MLRMAIGAALAVGLASCGPERKLEELADQASAAEERAISATARVEDLESTVSDLESRLEDLESRLDD